MFSVLTPYYNEEVLYSSHELNRKNEDGISILFYLQKIYPGELLTPIYFVSETKFVILLDLGESITEDL